jgi:hypothetical protein
VSERSINNIVVLSGIYLKWDFHERKEGFPLLKITSCRIKWDGLQEGYTREYTSLHLYAVGRQLIVKYFHAEIMLV